MILSVEIDIDKVQNYDRYFHCSNADYEFTSPNARRRNTLRRVI